MKLFTVEEANALLPQLQRLWADIGQQRDLIRRLAPESERADKRARENGGSSAGIRYLAALQQINELVQQIIALGIEIKDLERGLRRLPALARWPPGVSLLAARRRPHPMVARTRKRLRRTTTAVAAEHLS